ncbi:MAG: hypothetical protein ABW148_10315 [Sedimenticola sp.]
MPNEAGLAKKFGGPSDATCPMVRFSRLYDVLNKVVVHADMEPYDTGEREIAAKYLYEVNDQDFVLYDRGYAAFWLLAMHRDMNKTYCARVTTTYSKEIKAFLESGKKSDIILLKPNAKALTQCNEYYISEAPVRVRLVRVALGKGRTEVLVTLGSKSPTAFAGVWKKTTSVKNTKRVFDFVMQNGTSKSPFFTQSSTAYYCPGRSGLQHYAITSQARYCFVAGSRDDLTSRSYAIFGFPLALCARRASSIASRLPGTNRLGFQPSLAVSVSLSLYLSI